MPPIGHARFMAANMITGSAMLTVVSQATGQVSRAQKEGEGSAVATVGGSYSNQSNLDYYAEIDGLGTGEIGSSTFKWSTDDGATFIASGVATSATPLTLDNGVTIAWIGGTAADFVLGDKWRWKAYHAYHREKVLDRDRDSEWRSATSSSTVTVTIDLGSAQTPRSLILMDHNFSSAAEVTLSASNDAFVTAPVRINLTWRSGTIIQYFSHGSYRYWQISIRDLANVNGYLRMAEVFLGDFVEPVRTFSLGDVQAKERVGPRDRLSSGKFWGAPNDLVKSFDLHWDVITKAEADAIVAAYEACVDLTNRLALPVFFQSDHTDPNTLALCEWESSINPQADTQAPGRYNLDVRLTEIPRTY